MVVAVKEAHEVDVLQTLGMGVTKLTLPQAMHPSFPTLLLINGKLLGDFVQSKTQRPDKLSGKKFGDVIIDTGGASHHITGNSAF